MLVGISPAFPMPKTRDFVFGTDLLRSKNPQLLPVLDHAAAVRATMARALASGNSKLAIDAIEAYLPMMALVKDIVARGDATVQRVLGIPSFTWTSGCDKKNGAKEFTLYGWHFETCMVLSALAYARCNEASQIYAGIASEEDFDPAAKSAASLYRGAAGICNYISESVLPLPGSLPFQRPPEVLPDLQRAMSLVYRTTAQLVRHPWFVVSGPPALCGNDRVLLSALNAIVRFGVLQVCLRQAFRRSMSPNLIGRLHIGDACRARNAPSKAGAQPSWQTI